MGVFWYSQAEVVTTEPEIVKDLILKIADGNRTASVSGIKIIGNSIFFASGGYGFYGVECENDGYHDALLFERLFEEYAGALICFESVSPCQGQSYYFASTWIKPEGVVKPKINSDDREEDEEETETFSTRTRIMCFTDVDFSAPLHRHRYGFDHADIWNISFDYLENHKDEMPNLYAAYLKATAKAKLDDDEEDDEDDWYDEFEDEDEDDEFDGWETSRCDYEYDYVVTTFRRDEYKVITFDVAQEIGELYGDSDAQDALTEECYDNIDKQISYPIDALNADEWCDFELPDNFPTLTLLKTKIPFTPPQAKFELSSEKPLIQLIGEGIELEVVEIPAGTFWMGATDDELESQDNERPKHKVTVSSFYMGRFQVTQRQWEAIAQRTDLKVNIDLDPYPSNFKRPYQAQDRWTRPVERVDWDEAKEFCDRLSKLTERQYRLPTEAEWEYACRAGTTTPFYFGETISTELANYHGKYTYGDGVRGEYRGETTPVGYFKVANPFGLYDMHGNVWEWCEDDWHDDYEGAPTDGSAWLSGDKNTTQVIRGGSWKSHPTNCRCAVRQSEGGYYNIIGFRVVTVKTS